jgi:hypothetical protein
MQKGNSPNGVQFLYLRGTNFFEVQNGEMGYCTPKWGTDGNPVCYTKSQFAIRAFDG